MDVSIDWEQALESIDASNLPNNLTLLRGVSDAFGSVQGNEEDDLEAALFQALEDVEENPESPLAVSYNSSDESASEGRSIEHSSSSDYDEPKKKRVNRKRTTAGLSTQEKRELRKLRNRELAAESRKRKNDEMDRLRCENNQLKARVAELEKQLALTAVPMQTGGKRTRMGTTVGSAVAVAAMALFVVTGPAEQAHGLGSTASVLLTTLDSFDGQFIQLGKFIATAFLAAALLCVMGMTASRNAPVKLSSITSSFLPKRMDSMTLTNAV